MVGVPEWASAEWDGAEGAAGRRSLRPINTAHVSAGATNPDLRAPHSSWRLIGTERMNPTRTCALRTRLRDLNIEYSMLVKSKLGEGNSVRMAQLRGERAALMAMLSGERATLSVTSNQTLLNAVAQRSA